jgi:hypothetical protein
MKSYVNSIFSPENHFFIGNGSVFDEYIDENIFLCVIYLVPDRILDVKHSVSLENSQRLSKHFEYILLFEKAMSI